MIDSPFLENSIRSSLYNELSLISKFADSVENVKRLADFAKTASNILKSNGKILICGNGGSHCDAMHFAEELTGRFRGNRDPLAAICLGNSAHITCVSNDFGFSEIFSREIQALGNKGDILIVLSTSGNSENIIKAVNVAVERGLSVASFLGKTGGKLKGLSKWEWIIPGETSDRIQEMHMTLLHCLVESIERTLFPDNYK